MKHAERIRALGEDCDKTQAEIAKLLKIGQRTYCGYELGNTGIPVDSLIVFAKSHNVSTDYVCGLRDVRTPFPRS